MTADSRSLSFGREGERRWADSSAALRLSPGSLRALILADSSDVRAEVRRRLEALASSVYRIQPTLDVLERIHELARSDDPPLVWIEARLFEDAEDVEAAWLDALRALNRGRDLIADHGPVSVVLAGPPWLHDLVQRHAPDLSSVMDVTMPLDDTLEPLPDVQAPLCWMHLSDLHGRSANEEQDSVHEALLRDLPKLLEQVGRRPQLLFVTGDITAHGAEHEYDVAIALLEGICAILGIAKTDVFWVPGNHDTEPRRLTERLLGPARAVSIDQPWRTDVVEVSGVLVGVASICTAWSSGSERQVRALVQELEQSGAALRVALLHHPTSWLCEGEARTLQDLLRREFDLVLYGHAHTSAAEAVNRPTRDMVEIGAGAHGFWIAQLDPDAAELELDAFTWDQRDGGRWREAPAGRLSLALKLTRLGAAPADAKRQHELIAGRLRQAAARVHRAHAFVGSPRSTLDAAFVPRSFRVEGERELELTLPDLRGAWLRPGRAGEVAARVVILGEPGSGKSTLCHHLAVAAAEQDPALVPLLLTGRSWTSAGARESLLERATREASETLSVRVNTGVLEGLCERGRAILLIDDVSPTQRLRDQLHGFCEEYPRVPVIVTSRIIGYEEAPLDRENFRHLRLEPFSDPQLREFIERWYEIAEPDDSRERQRGRTALLDALELEPRAKALARNPRLAGLMAVVFFHRAELPSDRARLYALCTELLGVTDCDLGEANW